MERTEQEQLSFYEAALACSVRAEQAAGRREHWVEIAGVSVQLIFAGPRLELEFMGALSHLETDLLEARVSPDAVFHIWDSSSTGVAMVAPPCPQTCFTDRGDMTGFSSAVVRSAFHWSEYSVSLFDVRTGVGLYWVKSTEGLPYWAKSSPLRTLFHWVMETRGLQLVHAAAIGTAQGGVLIVGKGGVGKSTTALAGLSAEMSYVGDDYVVVGMEPEPTAYSLYCTAKLAPRQLDLLPELAPLVREPANPGEKAVIYLHPALEPRIVRSLPLRWLLTPSFGPHSATSFEPITPEALHGAAAFTTLAQLPHAGGGAHAFIGRLVAALPGRRMVLGAPQGVAAAIAQLLQELPIARPAGGGSADTPLVSVVIPVFDGARFLAGAVACVIGQSFPSVEIIVVDDGSTDDLEAVVASLPVDVRFLRQPNQGPAAARNRGVRDASGDFLAFLDVDDRWPPGTLGFLAQSLSQAPSTDVVLGRAEVVQLAADLEATTVVEGEGPVFPYYIGSALYRRQAFAKVGLFDETMRFGEDTDWFQRARERGLGVDRVETTTLIVQRHDANMTRGKTVVELNALRVLKNALDRSRGQAASASAQV